MSLYTMLTQVSADKTPPLTGDWRQFILDHLSYIAAESRTYDISPEVMNLYRFDLQRFLKERLQRRQNLVEIVLLLNNLDSDLYFKHPGEYLIPEDASIARLYSSYLTTVTNRS